LRGTSPEEAGGSVGDDGCSKTMTKGSVLQEMLKIKDKSRAREVGGEKSGLRNRNLRPRDDWTLAFF